MVEFTFHHPRQRNLGLVLHRLDDSVTEIQKGLTRTRVPLGLVLAASLWCMLDTRTIAPHARGGQDTGPDVCPGCGRALSCTLVFDSPGGLEAEDGEPEF